ncbi:hypothetical protein CAPTEDRAFT_216603 [Capitella teleta]|uniref:SOCS box domain-containing protein n=1 Tax=Capitella teleta TaxID=283909 RepID=R7U773_CAPTE|nr:hypothetical protein CAPTEDRAFT_216603 [Capitella teleta]|eukprot:ELU01966.1 hypothetical protein CAPTEDRAFT_216603 [Capitella teleta]
MNTSLDSLIATTMRFEDCKIYKAITETPYHKVAAKILELTEEKRDLYILSENGSTFLHVVVSQSAKFNQPRALPAVYCLCLAGIDVNARDAAGDTALHKLVCKEGVWRIVVALMRCGADPTIKNLKGKTPEDIIKECSNRLSDADVTSHWLSEFSPGLANLLINNKTDGIRCQQLLKSWCRTKIWRDGQWVELWRDVQGLSINIIETLRLHIESNELALHSLACNAKAVKQILKRGKANVNTKDASYQVVFPDCPKVDQPLIAAAWSTECYDVVEALMDGKPNTSLLYTNLHEEEARPLFFHVLDGQPELQSMSIAHRILRDADIKKRNSFGQNILFVAMHHHMPSATLVKLLQYGADLTARDLLGRNARDFAVENDYQEYADCIDQYVFELIVNKDLDKVQELVLGGYTHIWELLTRDQCHVARLNTLLEEDRFYRETAEYVKDIPRLQKVIGRIFYRLDNQELDAVRRIVGESELWRAKDVCGRNVLHRSLLLDDAEFASNVLSLYPKLAATSDNMEVTPLHLACLQFGRNHNVVSELITCGATWTAHDVDGRFPQDYLEENLAPNVYANIRKEIVQMASKVFLREHKFDKKLRKIIESGDLVKLKDLLTSMSPHVDFDAYSHWLFKCIDHEQPDIAAHLIRCGCNPDISHEEKCNNKKKGLREVSSLHDYALQKGFSPLANYIRKVVQYKKTHDEFGRQIPSPYETMDNFGLPS